MTVLEVMLRVRARRRAVGHPLPRTAVRGVTSAWARGLGGSVSRPLFST